MSWIHKSETDPSQISRQFKQDRRFKNIVSSDKKTYKSKRETAIANLIATSTFGFRDINAKES